MNPFFKAMNGGTVPAQAQGQTQTMNPMQFFQQFRQNPMQFILNRKFNIPQNLMGDPSAMIQHLVNSGQVNQNQLQQARQMMAQMQGSAAPQQ